MQTKQFTYEAKNAHLEVDGDKLIISVDLTKTFGLSKTGRTSTVSSTGGFVAIPTHPGIAVSLNVNKKAA